MFFTKYELPDGVMEDGEVCIGWVGFDAWKHIHWSTKRFCYAKRLPYQCPGYEDVLGIAIVVQRSDLLDRGYAETQYGFKQHFAWEEA